MSDMEPETIETDHAVELTDRTIFLRALRLEDASVVCEAVRESLDLLGVWLSWCHPAYCLDDTLEFLKARNEAFRKDGEHSFGIFECGSRRFLGGIGINQVDKAALRANMGYWLRTSGMGHGYATSAGRLLARFALERLGLERIEIVAATGNVPSQCVAERLGARREGIARQRLRVHGTQHDAVVYSLVKSDFQPESTA